MGPVSKPKPSKSQRIIFPSQRPESAKPPKVGFDGKPNAIVNKNQPTLGSVQNLNQNSASDLSNKMA